MMLRLLFLGDCYGWNPNLYLVGWAEHSKDRTGLIESFELRPDFNTLVGFF